MTPRFTGRFGLSFFASWEAKGVTSQLLTFHHHPMNILKKVIFSQKVRPTQKPAAQLHARYTTNKRTELKP